MKCPECGQWNRASMPHCINCGAHLNIDAASRNEWKNSLKDGDSGKAYIRVDSFGEINEAPDARDVLAREMHDLKNRKAEGAEALERLHKNTESRRRRAAGINVYSSMSTISDSEPTELPEQTHDSHETREELLSRMNSRQRDELRHRIRIMDENGELWDEQNLDPVRYDQNIYSVWASAGSTSTVPIVLPSRVRRLKAIVRILTVMLVVLLLGIGGYFGWNMIQQANANRQKTDPDVIITASLLNDLAAHTIMIPGTDGTQIYIRELHASYVVTDGYATVEVADHTWYDNYEGTLDEEMDVTLTPFLKSSNGKQTPLAPIYYTVSIPISPITLDSPDSLRTEVATTMSTIKITVRPGSSVTVNGEDYSDTVSSETGEMSYNATVQPIGDNVYTIVVRSQYCRDNTLKVTLYRAPQEIPLDLAVGTYGTTNNKTMKVTATTLPGAYVEVLSPYGDLDITNLDSTGKFTFNAVFDKIGNNTIIINASYPGKKTSVVEHTVYYLPPASEYTTKAWPLSEAGYAELLGNIQVRAERSQVYLVTGVVQYSVSEKPQMVVINTSADGKSQPVLVQNYTKTTWEVGQYYRIYADVYSTYNSMPWLNARYTYAK